MLSGLHDWLDRRRALRELRSRQKRDELDFQNEFDRLIEDAETAVRLGENDRGWEVWQRARGLFPDSTLASPISLSILLDLRRFDEAETLMREGCRRFPRTPFYFEAMAGIPMRRHDYAEALARSAKLQKQFPSRPMGYSIAANALRGLGRFEEAKSHLRRGMNFAPTQVNLCLDAGQLAIDTQKWEEGLDIYTRSKEFFRHVACPIGRAKCLVALGRYAEAEAELREAQANFPLDMGPWIEMARLAEIRGDWETASSHWAMVRKRYPMASIGYLECRRALRELGREAEIEPMLAETIDRILEDPSLLIEYAWIAHHAGNWAAAAERWALLRERFPDKREGWDRGAEALAALGREAEAGAVRAAAPA